MRRLLLVAVLLAASTVAVATPAYACSAAFPGRSRARWRRAAARYLVLARFQDGMLQTHLGSGTRPAPLMPPTTPPARPSPNRQIALTG
jgi:hypothetical protein